MSLLTKIFGDPNKRAVAKYRTTIEKINALEQTLVGLTDGELAARTLQFKERLAGGKTLDDVLVEAFAVVREAGKRTLKQRHFDVQLIGGMVLHSGAVAEMRTGEGKTLVATAPTYLNALAGKGVHVVTVNDYLARRDAVWMGQIYHALGLSVGVVNHDASYIYDPKHKQDEGTTEDKERDTTGSFRVQYDYLRPVSRKEAYGADVTYGTNNEFGFDYLRDNMATTAEAQVQRPPFFAVIDEVDSILIDEARTPLIISAAASEATDEYYRYAQIVRKLEEVKEYAVDEKMHSSTFTEEGIGKVTAELGRDPWNTNDSTTIFHLDAALKAHTLYKRDKNYVVRDSGEGGQEVVIVDEFTGRLMNGRRYSEGLHQAIEAKEGVKIQRESQTLATVTLQNLFRLYPKLAGMTGTAATEAEEFHKIYKLEVVTIPTNRNAVRKDLRDRIYKTEHGKFVAVVGEVKERIAKGQPVLLGTVSIEKNEVLSEMLSREGIAHNVLNAKNHEKEAEYIAQAGRPGAVTVATNMAGRGVDIILGGNPPNPAEAEKVRTAGGLHVIGTERHESRRIDNQLRGRAGRQGDPGSTQFYVSLDDDLMRIFATPRVKGMLERLGLPDDMPIENGMVSGALESAQGKVEGHNFDIRKHLLEYDDVLNKHRETIYRKRNEILHADDASALALGMVEHELARIVQLHTNSEDRKVWDFEGMVRTTLTIMPLPSDAPATLEGFKKGDEGGKLQDAEIRTKMIEYLANISRESYESLKKEFPDKTLLPKIVRGVLLRSIDTFWVQHLDSIDHLRAGIGLRGYGQRDPLVEYKREAFRMFNELQAAIERQAVYSMYKIGYAQQMNEKAVAQSLLDREGISVSAPDESGNASTTQAKKSPASGIEGEEKVGRNDLCPCGSGKKYKKCHGA